jgi:DNA helicase-2/ATP-dependent DNA helicase PcrA
MNPRSGEAYIKAKNLLNPEQKLAVNTLEGPVLVLAGPGTGKTQLLSIRIGNILATTDTSPENILCLTFSDSAVTAMKQRLANLIGPDAYDITVSTYHSFGQQLFNDYPEIFLNHPEDQPADELAIDRIVRQIQSILPYSNRLKADYYVKDIKSLISAFKRALISPGELIAINRYNQTFCADATKIVNQVLPAIPRMDIKFLGAFNDLLNRSGTLPQFEHDMVFPLKSLWLEQLNAAVETAQTDTSSKPLTKWKDRWISKRGDGSWQVLEPRIMQKLKDFAKIYDAYNKQLLEQGLYDYDDMITLAISGLIANPEIKLNLQERYQYIQLDEFQDTNKSQLRLVELLLDNTVNENRPNVLAVGDDDQAIYSFQGAHYSNMERFYSTYTNVKLIALKSNYRSTQGIIDLAEGVRNKIANKLTLTPKQQVSKSSKLNEDIRRVDLPLDSSSLAWTAKTIADLIKGGEDPSSIAVIAPKHEYLANLIPYLHAKDIGLSYDQRDDILDNPQINELLIAARLALNVDKPYEADILWPKILSFNYLKLPTTLIWQMSWQAKENKAHWTDLILDNDLTRPIGLFFIRLNQIEPSSAFEQMLNYLIGTLPLQLGELNQTEYLSPFFNYYLGNLEQDSSELNPDAWRLLGHISILRARAKSTRPGDLKLSDFIDFCNGYIDADIRIVDSSPFRENQSAVNLMTAYSAKGQEFDSVILIDCVDRAWGRSSRGRNHMVQLPPNLNFIRLTNQADDDKLRLLFVALSRAKRRLLLVGYKESLNGRAAEPIGYLDEYAQAGDIISPLLPRGKEKVILPPVSSTSINQRSLAWFDRHLDNFSPHKQALLQHRLDKFNLSSTNLNAYTNVIDGGPRRFFINQILKFPQPQSLSAIYGSAIHHTLDWQFRQTLAQGKNPAIDAVLHEFTTEIAKHFLPKADTDQLIDKGEYALATYIKTMPVAIGADDKSEIGFSTVLNSARLVGEIDRLIVDKTNKKLTIVDFKTGRTYTRWTKDQRPFHHKRQLYFYKLLLERSPEYKDYSIERALLQFVEPDEDDGQIKQMELLYDQTEEDQLKLLIGAVWTRIMALEFPDTSMYKEDINGILEFETQLLQSQK